METEAVVLQPRPNCKRCGAPHTIDNRVNWWDETGVAYGPKTKPTDCTTYILCDKCAQLVYGGRLELFSKLTFARVARPEEQRKAFSQLGPEDRKVPKDEQRRLVRDGIVIAAIHNSRTIGMVALEVSRESATRERYVVDLKGLWVDAYYRGLGLAQTLWDNVLQTIAHRDISYFRLDEELSLEEHTYASKYLLEPLGVKMFANGYKLKGASDE